MNSLSGLRILVVEDELLIALALEDILLSFDCQVIGPVSQVDEALAIKNTEIVKELALPPVKIHCSVLAEDAIRAAIGDRKKKNNVVQPAAETVAK